MTMSIQNISTNVLAWKFPAVPAALRFDRRRHHVHRPIPRALPGLPMENLLDDIFYAVEHFEQTYTLVRDQFGTVLFLLTSDRIRESVNQAVGTLVSHEHSLRLLYSIEDLIALDNFRLIARDNNNFEVVRVLIEIAKSWVRVPESTVAQMEMICRDVVYF